MLSEKERKGWDALENAAERAGGYVAYRPGEPLIMDYDYHAMSKYCRQKGVEPMELSEKEQKMFEFANPLVYPRKTAANQIQINKSE
jgi:hypothetical protein